MVCKDKKFGNRKKQEWLLPLTDPRDAEAQRIASYGNQTISPTRPSC